MYNSNMSKVIGDGKRGLIKAIIGGLIAAIGTKFFLRGYGEWAYGAGVEQCSNRWFKTIRETSLTEEELEEAIRKTNDD